jgi:hypothetical protein
MELGLLLGSVKVVVFSTMVARWCRIHSSTASGQLSFLFMVDTSFYSDDGIQYDARVCNGLLLCMQVS